MSSIRKRLEAEITLAAHQKVDGNKRWTVSERDPITHMFGMTVGEGEYEQDQDFEFLGVQLDERGLVEVLGINREEDTEEAFDLSEVGADILLIIHDYICP